SRTCRPCSSSGRPGRWPARPAPDALRRGPPSPRSRGSGNRRRRRRSCRRARCEMSPSPCHLSGGNHHETHEKHEKKAKQPHSGFGIFSYSSPVFFLFSCVSCVSWFLFLFHFLDDLLQLGRHLRDRHFLDLHAAVRPAPHHHVDLAEVGGLVGVVVA